MTTKQTSVEHVFSESNVEKSSWTVDSDRTLLEFMWTNIMRKNIQTSKRHLQQANKQTTHLSVYLDGNHQSALHEGFSNRGLQFNRQKTNHTEATDSPKEKTGHNSESRERRTARRRRDACRHSVEESTSSLCVRMIRDVSLEQCLLRRNTKSSCKLLLGGSLERETHKRLLTIATASQKHRETYINRNDGSSLLLQALPRGAVSTNENLASISFLSSTGLQWSSQADRAATCDFIEVFERSLLPSKRNRLPPSFPRHDGQDPPSSVLHKKCLAALELPQILAASQRHEHEIIKATQDLIVQPFKHENLPALVSQRRLLCSRSS